MVTISKKSDIFTKPVVVRLTIGGNKLMMHPMPKETLSGIQTGVTAPTNMDRPPHDICLGRIYHEDNRPDGRVGIPSANFFASIRGAGQSKMFKVQGKQITTGGKQKSSLLPGFLQMNEEFIPFVCNGDGEPKWVVDIRRVVNPSTGGANAGIRPKFLDWETEPFHIIFDASVISIEMIRMLVEHAGRYQGLCEYRPTKGGGDFGQFCIYTWEVVKGEEYLTAEAEPAEKPKNKAIRKGAQATSADNDKPPKSAQKKRRAERQKETAVVA